MTIFFRILLFPICFLLFNCKKEKEGTPKKIEERTLYSTYVTAKRGLNIRQEPNLDAGIIRKASYAEELNVVAEELEHQEIKTSEGIIDGTWFKIKFYNGLQLTYGYIFSGFTSKYLDIDVTLERYILNRYPNIDIDADGIIGFNDAISYYGKLSLPPNDELMNFIQSTKGIEAFIHLKELDLANHQIKEIDITTLLDLESLDLHHNYLISLNTSKNIKLRHLEIGMNSEEESFQFIDLSKNIALTRFGSIGNPYMNPLDISNNLKLEVLEICGENQKMIDLSQHKLLEELTLNSTGANHINIKHLIHLRILDISLLGLEYIDVSKNMHLIKLSVNWTLLKTLNLSNNLNLIHLDLENNKLTSLDVSSNKKLKSLNCQNNNLKEINLNDNPLLHRLVCGNNFIEEIDLKNNNLLTQLYLNDNQFKKIDLNTLTVLDIFYINNNLLSSLDLKNNTKLKQLKYLNNRFETINLSYNTNLEYVNSKDFKLIKNAKEEKEESNDYSAL